MGDMVSRDLPPGPPPQSRLAALFAAWRGLLSTVVAIWGRWLSSVRTTVVAGLGRVRVFLAQARSGSPVARARMSVLVGMLAVAIGVGATVLLAAPEARLRTVPAALVAAMWTCARLVAMRIAARSTNVRSQTIGPAWAAGALLHVFAVSSALRLVAWIGGFALTYRVLRVSGSSPRDRLTIAGWGYGLEAAGFGLLSLARSLQIAIMWLGGSPG